MSVYPNGISNSLPEDIQVKFVHSIPGFEKVEFLEWAYGIEHDYYDPTQLRHTMETKLVENLYFAGQINGYYRIRRSRCTGVLSPASMLFGNSGEKKKFVPERSEAYIGVLIDDLVTKVLTSLTECLPLALNTGLMLRQDNAFRMYWNTPVKSELPLLSRLRYIEKSDAVIKEETQRLYKTCFSQQSMAQLLHKATRLMPACREHERLDEFVMKQLEISVKYAGYIERELKHIKQFADMEAVKIPAGLDYESIKALRFEARQKLKMVQPATLGQASRIPGVNPADVGSFINNN